MGYKTQKVLKDNKKNLILFLVLWIVLEIVLIAPIATSIGLSTTEQGFSINLFLGKVVDEISSLNAITRVFNYAGIFGKTTLWFTIAYLACIIYSLIKSKPKHEFTDIEHGSSDWATGGEQYKILSPKKGILLAEKNYLPVDKRGNTNVLIVGRFWFW